MDKKINLVDFYNRFSDEKICRNYLEIIRWNNQIICPKCGSMGYSNKYSNGKLYKCSKCRKQFTVKVGTIFEHSKIDLQKWLLTIYLATNLKKGVSSIQLSRYIGVTQKTAWFMLDRIRHALEINLKLQIINQNIRN